MVTKVTYVGETFTRKPAKFERFIRPMGLRFRKVSFFGIWKNFQFARFIKACRVESTDTKVIFYFFEFSKLIF